MLAFENRKYTAYDRFHGNGPYGAIQTKKEPIRRLGFTSRLSLPYNNAMYLTITDRILMRFLVKLWLMGVYKTTHVLIGQ